MKVLQLQPLDQYGSPLEIINFFGGKAKYLQAVKELEREIYKAA